MHVCGLGVEEGVGRQRVNIIVSGHQMPAGWGTKGIDEEWIEQLPLFIAEPTERRSLPLRKHTGLDSCRYVWI